MEHKGILEKWKFRLILSASVERENYVYLRLYLNWIAGEIIWRWKRWRNFYGRIVGLSSYSG